MWNQLLYLTCSCSDLLIEKRTIIVLLLIDVTLLLLLFQVSTSQISVLKKEDIHKECSSDSVVFAHTLQEISSNHTRPLPKNVQLKF